MKNKGMVEEITCYICGEQTEAIVCQKCNNYVCPDCCQGMTQYNNIDFDCCKICANTKDNDY